MQRFIDPCCEECAHSKKTPCDQFVECCLSGPLCHENEKCRAAREAIITRLAHSPAFREQ
jgi:NADH-quinone oxidoreductase subunit F